MRLSTSSFPKLASSLALALLMIDAPTSVAQEDVMSPMRDRGSCQAVHAVQEPRVVVDCPADQSFDFCFTREMVDKAGIITGRLEFFADPSKGAEIGHSDNEVLYGGLIRIVTDGGALEMMETGVFDTESKEWVGLSTLSGGTGDFEGATGKLATFGDSESLGMVVGSVCSG